MTKAQIEAAVNECTTGDDEGDEQMMVQIIQAFDFPRFFFSPERKKFVTAEELKLPPSTLFDVPEQKSQLFCYRYDVIRQRLLRHKLFTSVGAYGSGEAKMKLHDVEFLLTLKTTLPDVIALGMVVQLKDSKYFLEDPSGVVPIDLSTCRYQSGIFTESCIVLIEGTFVEGVLRVKAIGHPPIETAENSRLQFGNINFFGGSQKTCAKSSEKLKHLEAQNPNAMLVFCSDVWLDKMETIEMLNKMFLGFQDSPPVAFVFCGNFLSTSYGKQSFQKLTEAFKRFAQLLQDFKPLLKSSRLVLVPGPSDLCSSVIYPKSAFPGILRKHFVNIPNVIFSTNPTRIVYCTQEIVIMREDLLHRMFRTAVHIPQVPVKEMPAHLVKCLLAQAHLSPLPLHVSPVYWGFDYTMRLYPVPDLLVLADKFDSYKVQSNGVMAINPGSFSAQDRFSFKVYFPQSKEVEESKISE